MKFSHFLAPIVALKIFLFLSAGNLDAALYNLVHRIQVDEKGTAGAIDGCAFSSDGRIVAASNNNGKTRLYRVEDGEQILEVDHAEYDVSMSGGETNAIDFSPDDRWFLTGMNDTGCKVWETQTGKLVKNLGHGTSTDGAAFSPDGKFLAVAQNEMAVIYSLPDFGKVAEISHTEGECNMVDWSVDSALLASCAGDGAVKVSKASNWGLLFEKKFPVDRVKAVRISPDGRHLAVSGGDHKVIVYRISDGKEAADLPHPSVVGCLEGDDYDGPPSRANIEACVWTNDSRYLITGGAYDGVLRVWQVLDWTVADSFQGQAFNRQVEYLRVSKDGVLASVGDEGFLYLFERTK